MRNLTHESFVRRAFVDLSRRATLVAALSFASFASFASIIGGCGGSTPVVEVPADLSAAPIPDLTVPIVLDLTIPPDLAPLCRSTTNCGGSPKACCDGSCTDTSSDVKNCGACGVVCAAGQTCCIGNCVDLNTNRFNCGACGTGCSFNNSAASCSGGQCSLGACQAGWGDCNMSATDGCETNLRDDPKNCKMCGSTCTIAHGVAGCDDNGCYLKACAFGFDDCNQDNTDGCESSVLADPKNCGGCGNDCNAPAPAHGKAGCTNAACQILTCDQGWLDCDGVEKNGCETSSLNDSNNCGACGNKCGQGLICKGGGCTCPNCAIPNASAKCINFVCLFDKCNPGFANCDGNLANGCETDLSSDPKNCGACGMVCPMGSPTCQAGACSNLYTPNGVQMNVNVGDLGGWTVCYQDTYNVAMQAKVPMIQAACTGSKLLLACRQNNSQTLTLLAAGDAADVMFDTGAKNNQGHTAGPVVWYFNANYSWGFATAGDQLALNQCDTNQGADRLCWHTVNNAGGYRCGATAGLNGSGAWDRLIYQAQ